MKILGIENMSHQQVDEELKRGARFVIFPYTISIIVMTFKRSSSVHFIPAGQKAIGKAAPFALLSFVLGWWGIPWGPIYTIQTIAQNLGGGVDVTADIVNASQAAAPIPRAPGV